jgi:thiol-disulfide isomerase/thioredoxin
MEEVPLLKELHSKYAKDVAIVGISVDNAVEPVDKVVKDKGMTWPILADGRGFDGPNPTAYHIQGTPELYVLDRAGKIFKRLDSAKELESTLQEGLAKR